MILNTDSESTLEKTRGPSGFQKCKSVSDQVGLLQKNMQEKSQLTKGKELSRPSWVTGIYVSGFKVLTLIRRGMPIKLDDSQFTAEMQDSKKILIMIQPWVDFHLYH